MKLKLNILATSLLFLLSACERQIYTPALYHQDIAYQPKPASFDSLKTANYISGGINYYLDQTWSDLLLAHNLILAVHTYSIISTCHMVLLV